jgi:hypothetical protein
LEAQALRGDIGETSNRSSKKMETTAIMKLVASESDLNKYVVTDDLTKDKRHPAGNFNKVAIQQHQNHSDRLTMTRNLRIIPTFAGSVVGRECSTLHHGNASRC